jgi:RHS repeat-associated protein
MYVSSRQGYKPPVKSTGRGDKDSHFASLKYCNGAETFYTYDPTASYNGEDNNDYVDGEVVQHIEYVPFGEVFVEEHSSSEDLPYKFNGKQFDEETSLYYYGARYMNPVASIWYGVDPLAEKYVTAGGYMNIMI